MNHINRARQLAGLPLLEKYSSSSEFDADISQVLLHISAARKILSSKNFKQHLADTERNFEVEGIAEDAKSIDQELQDTAKKTQALHNAIIKASE